MTTYYERSKGWYTCLVDGCHVHTMTEAGMHLHLAVWHGIRLASPPSDAPLGSDLPRVRKERT